MRQLCQVVSRDIVPAHTALPQGHTKRISASGRPTSQRFLEYYEVAQWIVKTRRGRGSCGKQRREQKCTQVSYGKTQKERDNLEDLGIDVRVILKPVLKGISLEGLDWVHLVQDMGTQWVLCENGKKTTKFQNFLGNYWSS